MESLKSWFNNNKVYYKGYNISTILLVEKYLQTVRNKKFLKNNYLNIIKKIIAKKVLIYFKPKILVSNIENLINKNFYIVNFKPNDLRHFLHIHNIIKIDKNAVVGTVVKETYNYYKNLKIPVIFYDVAHRLKHENKINFEQSFTLNEILLLNRAAALIDIIEKTIRKYGYPKTLIVLQDFHAYDSIFTNFFKNKIPTITLQHGISSILPEKDNSLWNFVFSDYIIAFGNSQKEVLKYYGIEDKKIIPLGTAKYDEYFKLNLDNNFSKNVVLLSIPPLGLIKNDFIDYLIELISKISNIKKFNLKLRFHPANRKDSIKNFLKTLKKHNIKNFVVSNENDPIKDIIESDIVLTNSSGIAYEAMLFHKPVIEFYSDNNDLKFDYRIDVLNVKDLNDIMKSLERILTDKFYLQSLLEKQNSFINNHFTPPPSGERILKFINEISK
jgi:CDP-glycerol glycerophosphotransferase (TagB/SpsB family)